MSVDIELIQDELINILIAGRDTTASCTSFAVYLLSQHPDVLKRLSEEVHSVLASPSDASDGDNESPSQPPTASPTLDNLRQMPYLRAVINETLRLFPSVPFNVRDNIAERVWVGGDGTRWYLPAGTKYVFPIHLPIYLYHPILADIIIRQHHVFPLPHSPLSKAMGSNCQPIRSFSIPIYRPKISNILFKHSLCLHAVQRWSKKLSGSTASVCRSRCLLMPIDPTTPWPRWRMEVG
jgi:hypothetical protein